MACLRCGSDLGANPRAVYCSRRCKEAAKEARRRAAVSTPHRQAECGTRSGYARHLRHGEAACAECLAAEKQHGERRRRLSGMAPRRPAAVRIACLVCGQAGSRKLCSAACRSAYRVACPECEATFAPTDAVTRYCSLACRRRAGLASRVAANERRRARKRGALVGDPFDRHEVFERDAWVCQLCSEPVDSRLAYPDRMSATLDHIVPIARGGGHSRANTQLAHMICNARKGARVDAIA